jgi:NifU-like protein involved in Fe-S cluster formation
MDEAVIKYYRRMLRGNFEHTGSLPSPSIFLDSVGERIRVCGQIANNYLHLYLNVAGGRMAEVRYLCTCDPTANVAIEILCWLIKGATLDEALALTEESFHPLLGGASAELDRRAINLLELLRRGILRYQAAQAQAAAEGKRLAGGHSP